MYELKEKTKRMIEVMLGIPYEKYVDVDYNDSLVKPETIEFLPETDARIIGRGNPLLARNEFLTMDEVDKVLGEL